MFRLDVERFRFPDADREVLAGVNLAVSEGEIVALTGPIGVGKSTTLGLAAGLHPRYLPGEWVGARSLAPDARVGFVHQHPDRNLCTAVVEEEFALALDGTGLNPVDARRLIADILERFGLGAVRERTLRELSLGTRQWVSVAACLLANPNLLLLDEPTAHLDEQRRDALAWHLGTWVAQAPRRAVVIATHDIALIKNIGARVVEIAASPAQTGRGPFEFPGGASTGEGDHREGDLLLEARDLEFAYPGGRPVLRGVNLRVRRGDCVVIEAPNNAGKSTLGLLLAGLLRPTGGEVRAAGQPVPNPRRVAYVTQSPSSQLFGRTVAEELSLTPCALERESKGFPVELVLDAVEPTRDPAALSGGQQKVLQVAAFAGIPEVLIVDEPPTECGSTPAALEKLLSAGARRSGALVVFTHDASAWETRATRRLSLPVPALVVTASRPFRSASASSRAALLLSLALGMFTAGWVLAGFAGASLAVLGVVDRPSLRRPLLWAPVVGLFVITLVVGWMTGQHGTLDTALVGAGRLVVACATGVALPGFLTHREVAGGFARIGVPGLGVAVFAAYRALPSLIALARDVRFGAMSRGLYEAGWWSATRRVVVSAVLLLLEQADSLAMQFDLRGIRRVGDFPTHPPVRRVSLVLFAVCVVNLTIVIIGSGW